MCRKVCLSIVSVANRGQMAGTAENPVQINGARFAIKRKYNQGRLLTGDQRPESTDSSADVVNNGNHGRRIDLWVFGVKNGLDCRNFLYTEKTELP